MSRPRFLADHDLTTQLARNDVGVKKGAEGATSDAKAQKDKAPTTRDQAPRPKD